MKFRVLTIVAGLFVILAGACGGTESPDLTVTPTASVVPTSTPIPSTGTPVCPVTAIFAEEDTPDEWENFKDINYEYFGLSR